MENENQQNNTSNLGHKEEEKGSEMAIRRANEAAERIEAANKRQEELLARYDREKIERIIAGRSDAGQNQAKDLTPQEREREFLKKTWPKDLLPKNLQ